MYKNAESNPEREITKCPHDTCSQLLILQCSESSGRGDQVSIRRIEGCLGKGDEHCQHNVLCYGDSHAPQAAKVAQALMERRASRTSGQRSVSC